MKFTQNVPLALIVEDDVDQAAMYSRAVEAAGYSVHRVHDGQNARLWLDENIPTILLLDLNLPHLSGTTLLKRIKLDPRLDKTKIIIVSGISSHYQFLPEDVELILNKPVSLQQLQLLSARFIC